MFNLDDAVAFTKMYNQQGLDMQRKIDMIVQSRSVEV